MKKIHKAVVHLNSPELDPIVVTGEDIIKPKMVSGGSESYIEFSTGGDKTVVNEKNILFYRIFCEGIKC